MLLYYIVFLIVSFVFWCNFSLFINIHVEFRKVLRYNFINYIALYGSN